MKSKTIFAGFSVQKPNKINTQNSLYCLENSVQVSADMI